jgi:hypothetical protein
MARSREPHPALFRSLEELVAPGDQTTTRLWGLTGWSMNWWIVATDALAVPLVVPFIAGLRELYTTDIAVCASAGVLLSASFWTRPGLAIAITSHGQVLCCRFSRPFMRTVIARAPMDAARFARIPSWLGLQPASVSRTWH